MSLLKKLSLSFLSSLLILISIAPNFFVAKAQDTTTGDTNTASVGTWYSSSFNDWYGKVYDPKNQNEIFGERYTAAQVEWVIYGFFGFLINSVTGPQNSGLIQCFLINTADITPCTDKLKVLIGSTNSEVDQKASLPPTQNLWSLVFATDRPLSGIAYFKEKARNFSLVPVANAAPTTPGFGYNALQPVQNMWKGVRDIAFGLFVLAAIILAFMIMFRVKISPQVIISVQSAIPKIIIALVLVTFSYAIAGFVIDLMYVVLGFTSLALSPMVGNLPPVNVFNFLTLGQPLGGNVQFGFLLLGIIYVISFLIALIILLFLTLGLLGTAIAVITVPIIAAATGGIGPLIMVLLIIVAILIILWIFVKILFSLIKAFATVIILVIFAPLQIVAGVVIPNFGFGAWLKSYVAALSTFVVTGILTLLSFIFLGQGITIGFSVFKLNINPLVVILEGSAIGSAFHPILGSAAWPPLLGGGDQAPVLGLLFLGISFVVFSTIPKASELVQSFITGKPFAYGLGIGEVTTIARYGVSEAAAGKYPFPINLFTGGRGTGDFRRGGKSLQEEAATAQTTLNRILPSEKH